MENLAVKEEHESPKDLMEDLVVKEEPEIPNDPKNKYNSFTKIKEINKLYAGMKRDNIEPLLFVLFVRT